MDIKKYTKCRPFLCLRRGVSNPDILTDAPQRLFSAYAEVFLSDPLPAPEFGPFLCLRRGVSLLIKVDAVLSVFSLPTQRCFRIADSLEGKPLLFSAYAEVFLAHNQPRFFSLAFLCLRRGVSDPEIDRAGTVIFSLPTQRCFHLRGRPAASLSLFSAYAEVFLSGAFG